MRFSLSTQGISRDAYLSPCRRYRYSLERRWGEGASLRQRTTERNTMHTFIALVTCSLLCIAASCAEKPEGTRGAGPTNTHENGPRLPVSPR